MSSEHHHAPQCQARRLRLIKPCTLRSHSMLENTLSHRLPDELQLHHSPQGMFSSNIQGRVKQGGGFVAPVGLEMDGAAGHGLQHSNRTCWGEENSVNGTARAPAPQLHLPAWLQVVQLSKALAPRRVGVRQPCDRPSGVHHDGALRLLHCWSHGVPGRLLMPLLLLCSPAQHGRRFVTRAEPALFPV